MKHWKSTLLQHFDNSLNISYDISSTWIGTVNKKINYENCLDGWVLVTMSSFGTKISLGRRSLIHIACFRTYYHKLRNITSVIKSREIWLSIILSMPGSFLWTKWGDAHLKKELSCIRLVASNNKQTNKQTAGKNLDSTIHAFPENQMVRHKIWPPPVEFV